MNLVHKVISFAKKHGVKATSRKIFYYATSKLKLLSFRKMYVILFCKKFKNNKPVLAMYLTSMDKGGLEEVVLSLSNSSNVREMFNIVIIESSKSEGYLREIAQCECVKTFSLKNNAYFLSFLIKYYNIQIAHIHYEVFSLDVFKANNVSIIYTIHNNYIWLNDSDIIFRKESYKYVDFFVAVSTQVREFFCAKFDVDESKVHVINNGLELFDIDSIVPSDKIDYGFEDDDYIFINIATFSHVKRHVLQLQIMKKLSKLNPKVKLIMLGNASDKEYLGKIKKYICVNELENYVKIIDYVPKEKVFSMLKMVDALLVTSITEGFSIATLEAAYAQKPMILSNVGGARDLVSCEDIGIVVDNLDFQLHEFNFEIFFGDVWSYRQDKYELDRYIEAIETLYFNKGNWKEKGKKGKNKVESYFNTDNVSRAYAKYYKAQLDVRTLTIETLSSFLESQKFEICVFGLFPARHKVVEGWMSRMLAVDSLIANKSRIYLNPFSGVEFQVVQHDLDVFEILCDHSSDNFHNIVSKVISAVEFTYVHTLHLAEYIVPYIKKYPIIVDIHGVTPEEEVMCGHPHLEKKYAEIEEIVLQHARYCIMVSRAMEKHYALKYPSINPRCMVLPIVEQLDCTPCEQKMLAVKSDVVIYAGSTAAWQNIDAMLYLAKSLESQMNFMFLSHEYSSIEKKAKKYGITNSSFFQCGKDELKGYYATACYGLLLRDASPVNFVACPTKAYEYMASGIVPIVRTTELGDLSELGFVYITEENFLNGKRFSCDELRQAIVNNQSVVRKMQDIYKESSSLLLKLFNEKFDS